MSDQNLALIEVVEAKAVQHLFAQSLAHGRIILKGGLAMRLLYGSSRATQDIDLNADEGLSTPALSRAMNRAIERTVAELKTAGLITEGHYTRPKQTQTTARWKVACSLPSGAALHFKIEVSRRAQSAELRTVQRTTRPVTYGALQVPSVLVEVYGPDSMAVAKTVALLAPNRNKPRDLYDLHVLIESNVTPGPALNAWAEAQERRGVSREAMVRSLYEKIEAMNYPLAQAELIPHLDTAVARRLDEPTWDEMRIRVAQGVESWLRGGNAGEVGPRP